MISAFSAGLRTLTVPQLKSAATVQGEFAPELFLLCGKAWELRRLNIWNTRASLKSPPAWERSVNEPLHTSEIKVQGREENREMKGGSKSRSEEGRKSQKMNLTTRVSYSCIYKKAEDDKIDFSPCSCVSISHPFMRNRGNQRINLTRRQATFDLSKSAAFSFSASSFIICQLYPFLHFICLRPF